MAVRTKGMQNNLVLAINNYQEKTGLTTSELANKLGLHLSTLYRLKQGNRNPGNKVYRAICQQIPELRGAINESLVGGNTPSASHHSVLGQNLRAFRRWLKQLVSHDIVVDFSDGKKTK